MFHMNIFFFVLKVENDKNVSVSDEENQSKISLMSLLKSFHPYLEGVLLVGINWEKPTSLDGIAIKLSLVVYGVLSDVFFCKANSCCIVIKTSWDLKFANCVFPSSADFSLRDRGDIEVLKCHWILLIKLDIVAGPLPSLDKIWHQELIKYNLILQMWELNW